MMNKNHRTKKLVLAAFSISIASSAQTVFAGVDADCRQEAEEYGIEPEQRQEYIKGCVESRGGMDIDTTDSMEEPYVEPSESADTPEAVEEEVITTEQ